MYALPEVHRRRMRTSNMLERQNQELKRRTCVVRVFPNNDGNRPGADALNVPTDGGKSQGLLPSHGHGRLSGRLASSYALRKPPLNQQKQEPTTLRNANRQNI